MQSMASGSSRDKVRQHRARLRALGMRPLQIWVPDTASAAFTAAAHRQAATVAGSVLEPEDQAFVDSLGEDWARWGATGRP